MARTRSLDHCPVDPALPVIFGGEVGDGAIACCQVEQHLMSGV